jgi:short-subunit dehydrogenase
VLNRVAYCTDRSRTSSHNYQSLEYVRGAHHRIRMAGQIESRDRSTRPVALVTGASRGIGAATARELARRGYSIAITARTLDGLNATAAATRQIGAETLVLPADIRDPRAASSLARDVLDHFDSLDVLVNNAGAAAPLDRFDRLSQDQIESIIATNLMSAIRLTRAVLPTMIERRRGNVVFVGSVGGRIGLPSAAMYSTSKFGLRGFAFALGREIRPYGLNVSVISAGFVRSALTESIRGVPFHSPELVARRIAGVLLRPKREVIVPRYYRVAIWLDGLVPWVVDRALSLYTQETLGDRPRIKPD